MPDDLDEDEQEYIVTDANRLKVNAFGIGTSLSLAFKYKLPSLTRTDDLNRSSYVPQSATENDLIIDRLFGKITLNSFLGEPPNEPKSSNVSERRTSEPSGFDTGRVDHHNDGVKQLNTSELFKARIASIKVYALSCNKMPSGSNMIKMLNISSVFKRYGYVEEYYECVFLTGLTMMSARKYVQSVEFFRNVQKHIFNMIHNVPDDIEQTSRSHTLFTKSFSEKTNVESLKVSKQESTNSYCSDPHQQLISQSSLK